MRVLGGASPCYDFSMPASEVLAEPCSECGGRGWVVVADGRAGTARLCACQQRDVLPRLIQASGIPARYRHCRLSNFHVSSARSRQEPQLVAANIAVSTT